MAQQDARAVFDSLLTKTHVRHALYQPGNLRNKVPSVGPLSPRSPLSCAIVAHQRQALATVALLNGASEQLQAVYDRESSGLRSWTLPPGRISDVAARARFLGDVR